MHLFIKFFIVLLSFIEIGNWALDHDPFNFFVRDKLHLTPCFFLLSLGTSSRRHSPLSGVVDSVMAARQAWRSRGSWWSMRPYWPLFSLGSYWPGNARYSGLALDPWRPWRSWETIFTRGTHITFLAPLTFWAWWTHGPLISFATLWPSTATRTSFTRYSFGTKRTFRSSRSTISCRTSVTFAASQPNGSFWAIFTTVPFGSWGSRSAC